MVGELLDLISQALGIQRLQGRDNLGMQHSPPLLEETAIGHLLGQGVLKGVDQLGKQIRLIQELGVLEMREAQAERLC